MPANEQDQFFKILSVARARADLKAPTTLLLVALLALSAGCSAKVEVSHETKRARAFHVCIGG
jgi:hypothetical protein